MAHDFYIGDLGFHKIINDQHPYERATAPFRKEQFDAAATVGDQSLAGWWTRGQLSFHKGAGLKYYEVLDGEEILSRYQDSVAVDPWTPGEVTLGKAVTRVAAGQVVSAASHGTGQVAAALDDGTVVLADATVSAAQTVEGSASITSLTTSGSVLYGAAAGGIYKSGGANFLDKLWTPDVGATFSRVWWAKSRLWVLDGTSGNWYTLTTAGGTAATGDIFWQSGKGVTGWSFAEGPGPVYLSHGSEIYAVTLNTDGTVPTISTPTVAASLPGGEEISSIFFYLGKLVICSNRGVRVALVGTDGSLTYGAHVISGDFSDMAEMDATGDLVYVSGQLEGESSQTLFTLNLTIDVEDLRPAYAAVHDTGATGGTTGAAVDSEGAVMAWDADGFLRIGSALATSGTLTTGFHRLGTLDPKSFQYLRVKTEGTVGSVAVTAVLPDGQTASVGTVMAGTSSDLALGSAVSGALEYIGLKFTFSGDGASGPTLLGYQLKALPIPKRQRLIRVGLMMFDTEQGPTGRAQGAQGSAWTRLQALEELEESNSVVQYEDTDTGETGTAYIETVEVLRHNIARGRDRSHGFGGVITVTLRKVA